MKREDIVSMVKDVLGEVRAEVLEASHAKSDENNTPEKIAQKAIERAKSNRAKISARDDIHSKDIEEMTPNERARMAARWLQCAHQAHRNGTGAKGMIDIAQKAGQVTLVKNMQASDFDEGGFMLPVAFADGIIAELVARSVYLKAEPRTLELPEGGLNLPYEDDGADAQWSGEGTEVNAETITGGRIRLQPHKLITIVGVSNDLLRSKVGRSDQFIVDSIVRGMRTKLDSTLLRSSGVSDEPMGLYSLAQSAHKFNVTAEASLSVAILVEELLKLQDLIETDDVDLAMDRPHYFMAPRTKNYLRAQRATDGVLFPEMSEGELLGVPFGVTSNIPINLGGSSDESEIYCAAMAHMILGESEDTIIEAFPGGTYKNASGTMKSGVSADETPIRAIAKYDHAAGQRGNEIAVAEAVDWVAG